MPRESRVFADVGDRNLVALLEGQSKQAYHCIRVTTATVTGRVFTAGVVSNDARH